MHALHKILVKVSQDTTVEEARAEAESATQEFGSGIEFAANAYPVYDWRETDTAGRWEDEYPTNVIFSRDDLDKFIGELRDCMDAQRSAIDHNLKILKRYNSDGVRLKSDIDKIVNDAYEYGVGSMALLALAELVDGRYTFDSGFFDTTFYTAKINEKTIERVEKAPNEWALVMFDYHN